jgi:hypothetical protein
MSRHPDDPVKWRQPGEDNIVDFPFRAFRHESGGESF